MTMNLLDRKKAMMHLHLATVTIQKRFIKNMLEIITLVYIMDIRCEKKQEMKTNN